MIEGYLTHLLIIIGIFVILSVSLNLSIGFTGLLNLGHVAFFGMGAYTSALLVMHGWPYLAALLMAGVVASIGGALMMFAVRKLSGDYLALATLGFSFVIYSILLNWSSLTRGPLGIPGIPKPEIFGLVVKSNYSYLLFVAIITALVVGFLYRLTRSRYGRLLEAVRDDEVGLSVYGKPIFKLKLQSLMISSFIAGIAGSLFAHYISFIDPSSFYLTDLILLVTVVMIGGLASIRGSIVATIIILLIPEVLRFVDMPSSIIGPARQIIYALFLILILLYKPRGLFGKVDLG